MIDRRTFMGTGLAAFASANLLPRQARAAGEETIYVSVGNGADTNPGTKQSSLKTLSAAAKRVNEAKGNGPTTIILAEGIYPLDQTVMIKPGRSYTETERLTIRAESLPDDPDWGPARMPVLVPVTPLSKDWNDRPDPFDGAVYGMQIETSHATVQGIRMCGMPIIEHPKAGAIHRLYGIGRIERTLEDLEVKQCLFTGDEVTNPNHLALLINGNGLVVDHCLFYGIKQTVVFLTPGSTGHAMRNCLVWGSYATGIWTSGVAKDLDYRNNIVSNSFYVWIGQGARSAQAELDQIGRGRAGGPPAGGPPAGGPPQDRPPAGPVPPESRYNVRNCLFAGNKRFTGSGGGPALNFRDNDPSFLNLIDTKITGQPVQLEFDQTKRNYLHVQEGTSGSDIGAGLFTKKS
jgi:hypothetical protein